MLFAKDMARTPLGLAKFEQLDLLALRNIGCENVELPLAQNEMRKLLANLPLARYYLFEGRGPGIDIQSYMICVYFHTHTHMHTGVHTCTKFCHFQLEVLFMMHVSCNMIVRTFWVKPCDASSMGLWNPGRSRSNNFIQD